MKFVLFNIVVGAALAYLLISDRGEDRATALPAPRTVAAGEASGSAAPVANQAKPAPALEPARQEMEAVPSGGADGAMASGPLSPSPPAPKTHAPVVDGTLMTDAARGRSLRDLARDMEGRFLTGVR